MNRPVVKCLLQYVVKGKFNRANRYVFNKTFDACDFMEKRKSNMVLGMLMNFIMPFTNMNHSCPYDVSFLDFGGDYNKHIYLFFFLLFQHDIFIKDFNSNFAKGFAHKLFPWPIGQYKAELSYILDKSSRINVYFDYQVNNL